MSAVPSSAIRLDNPDAILTRTDLRTLGYERREMPTGEPSPDHPEGWEINAYVPIVFQFTPEEPGPYTLALHLNDRWAERAPPGASFGCLSLTRP